MGQRSVGAGSGTEVCWGREWDRGLLGHGVGQRAVGTGKGTEGCWDRERDRGLLGHGMGRRVDVDAVVKPPVDPGPGQTHTQTHTQVGTRPAALNGNVEYVVMTESLLVDMWSA